MNCIIIDDDKLSRKVIEEFVHKSEFLNLINSYSNAVEAMNAFAGEDEIHLIFLDIEMPEMSGLEFLKTIESQPMIIIVSGKEKYALEAYEYDVIDYLLKPIQLTRFLKSVNKAYRRYNEKSGVHGTSNEIFIKKKNSTLVRINYDEILWVEALENYVIISTYNEKFTIHFTMKSISMKLPPAKFKRIHRSFIVNVNRIEVIEDNSIIIKVEGGNKVLPIGKSYKEKLLNELNLISK